jgi:hypothetical protein
MRIILSAIAVSVLLAIAAGGAYYFAQEPVYSAQPKPSVRIGDPGENLVGPSWSGNPGRGENDRSEQAGSPQKRSGSS